MKRKVYSNSILKYAQGVGARQIRVVASTATKDRVGDVMIPEGCDLSDYRMNPVVLFGHDPTQPIGNAAVEVKNGRVEALITFAPSGASARADEVCALAKAGVLSAVSVGFEPIASEPIKGGGWKYTRWSLYELSIVSVPANADAQIIERAILGRGVSRSSSSARSEEIMRLKRSEEIARLEWIGREQTLSVIGAIGPFSRVSSESERRMDIARMKAREEGLICDLRGADFAHAMARKIERDALGRASSLYEPMSTKALRDAEIERLRRG